MRNMHTVVIARANMPARNEGVPAFADVVARYKRPLFAYLFRMTGDAQDAEDLT